MYDFIKGVATIAAGVLVAGLIGVAVQQALKPAKTVSIDMQEYACQLAGSVIECQRR